MARRSNYPFRESDSKYGVNLLANLITLPYAILVDIVGSSEIPNRSSSSTEYKPVQLTLREEELALGIDELLIRRLCDEAYKGLNDAYKETVTISKQINTDIKSQEHLLKKYETLNKCFRFIPALKKRFTDRISEVLSTIKKLRQQSYIPYIPIKSIIANNKKIHNIDLCGYAFVFEELKDWIGYGKRLEGMTNSSSFFHLNVTPIASLNCKYLQVHFFESCLIIMTQKIFSVIDYTNVNLSYSPHIIKEAGLNSYDGLKIINDEWRYFRVDGSPDRRHKVNWKLYSVEYGALILNIKDSFKIRILFNEYCSGKNLYDTIVTCNNT